MNYLRDIDHRCPECGAFHDELPLWSAPFGLLLLECVPLRSGITVMDVGAGTGFLSVELAQRCGSDSTVVAVDPWAAGLKRLREKLDYLGITNVRLIESDATHVDLPEASIDLIVSNLGINNFENADAVLEKCFRLAKPGATLALTTNVVGHMQEFYDVYRTTLQELGLSDRLSAFDDHVRHRGTVESVKTLLESAGFQIVGVATHSFKMRFADGSSLLRHHFIRLGFLPDWKRLLPPGLVEKTFASLEERLNDLAEQRGLLALTVPVVCVEARKPHVD
jgi:ubiquinone/menaquinone biosynthesis C-methylase UbiE